MHRLCHYVALYKQQNQKCFKARYFERVKSTCVSGMVQTTNDKLALHKQKNKNKFNLQLFKKFQYDSGFKFHVSSDLTIEKKSTI